MTSSPRSQETTKQTLQKNVEERLQRYARFGVDLGLDRIESLLSAMGNPQQNVPIIHVAGTNGKGSVCAYLSSVLTAAGYRTGRYTSPHLVNWTERICIDGEPITWTALQSELDAVEQAIANRQRSDASIDTSSSDAAIDAPIPTPPIPTQFEVFTAAAWQYFARQQVDIAVVEVGLGGRLDATNVCRQPLATVIVSIGRDHWQRLGNTLAEIAGEKAGILKPGACVIAGPLPPEAAAVVTAKSAELSAPLTWVTPAEEITVEVTEEITAEVTAEVTGGSEPTLRYHGIQYPQVLLGSHQRVNSACAIATLQSLKAQGWHISDEAIARGMATVSWPGRLQKSQWQGHPLLIDGAHNADAAQVLRAYLDRTYPHQPMTWLMGMLATKDHPGVLGALLRPGDRLHLVPVPGHLSADPAELSALAQQICPTLADRQIHPDLIAALTAATQPKTEIPTIFCGSLYLIGSFFEQYA